MERFTIRGDRLALFLKAVVLPGRVDLIRDFREEGSKSSFSIENIRALSGADDNVWIPVALDRGLDLLGDVFVENDSFGSFMFYAVSVYEYVSANYPSLLPFLEKIARGEITEEMLKKS